MIERIQTQAWSRSTKQACVVCAAVLPPLRTTGQQLQAASIEYPCCRTVACRMIVSRRSEMSEAGFKHYLEIEARQTQGRLVRAKRAQEKNETEARENLAAWNKLKRKLVATDPQPLLLHLGVPSGPLRASKVAAKRIKSYREHLTGIIAEALGPAELEAEPLIEKSPLQTPPIEVNHGAQGSTSDMPGRLCAFCGGGCCTRGGEHAYLTAATVRGVMLDRPHIQNAKDLLAIYMERLPSKAQTGSCINHGPQGCTLSRELRSGICNNYACEALARLQYAQRKAEQSTPKVEEIAVLLLRRKQDNWSRATLDLDNSIRAGGLLTEAGFELLAGPRTLSPKKVKPSSF